MAEQEENRAVLSEALTAQLRAIRARMLEQLHTHGIALLPEQSLALRSQVSYITQIIEPGTQEMWPEYSAAEKNYMDEQRLARARDANHIAMAALGPLSLPAYLVERMHAPPQVVANFIELGFNLAAAAEINQVRLKHLKDGTHPVRPPTKVEAEFDVEPRLLHIPDKGKVASNMDFIDGGQVISFDKYQRQRVYSQEQAHGNAEQSLPLSGEHAFGSASLEKLVNSMATYGKAAEPIMTWLEEGNLGTFSATMHQYFGKGGALKADVKAMQENVKTIDKWLEYYANDTQGAQKAISESRRVTWRLLNDISSRGEVSPSKLETVMHQLAKGEYLTAHDIAALEYTRQVAHARFVESKVDQYVSTANVLKLEGEILQNGIQSTRELAEKNSPYLAWGEESPDRGFER